MSYPISIVPFHGDSIITLDANGNKYVVLKPIAEALGLSWASQTVKLQGDSRFNCFDIETVGMDGKSREMLCIPLRKLNGWLFSINPNKIRPDLKEKVIQYQEECFEVLYRYWHEGAVIRNQPTSDYDAVDTARLNALRQLGPEFALSYLHSLGINTPTPVTGNWFPTSLEDLYEGLKSFAREYDHKHFFITIADFNSICGRKKRVTLKWLDEQGYLNPGEPHYKQCGYRKDRKCNQYVADKYFSGKRMRVYAITWKFFTDVETGKLAEVK